MTQIGMLNNTYAQLAYAYRIPVGNGTLSAGIQAELEFARIDWTKAIALDPNDPNIQATASNSTKPNFGVGLYYTNPRFFAGILAPRFLKTSYYQKGGDCWKWSKRSKNILWYGWIYISNHQKCNV